jgi:hypothetical protein
MSNEVAKLLAELFFRKETVSDWAIKCLEKGYDSRSLRILASMNSSDSASEFDQYLKRSLKELGWEKIDRQDFLIRYAKILAKGIIKGKADPIDASRDIYQILKNLDYPSELHGWYAIDDMIWDYEYFLKTGEQGYWFHSKEELISEIKRVSEELIKSEEV